MFSVLNEVNMGRTKYYHVDEVAELVGLSSNEVRDMLKRKELKGHKLGRRWLIDMNQPYFNNTTCIEKQEQTSEHILDKERKSANKRYIFDKQAEKAIKFVDDGESLFITGKAGTGKTTLLKEILRRNEVGSQKNVVILAPTGVAAENAGGMTMHHFFQLPMKPYLPKHKVQPNLYKLKSDIVDVVRSLDLLIIDEISMVRCDMLDAMDDILRHYRKNEKPFGGIQVVMFGDLYQLSPVIRNNEWGEMKEYYQYAYFFCSHALIGMKYKVVELDKVYRQENNCFIDLLNKVRLADISKVDLAELNRRYQPGFSPNVHDDVVTLMTHNKRSNKWNQKMFSLLEGKVVEYKASANDWYGGQYPVAYHLELKVGARVMFLRNTELYKNGTMGRVFSLEDDSIFVRKDDGNIVQVSKAVWKQLKYIVDKKEKTIKIIESGTYIQYPLKLAWAVSIHKSQGLTFDEVAIDASKAFAPGQVYVALSRCRTFEGIHLLSRISNKKILVDDVVKEFQHKIDENGNVLLEEISEPIRQEVLVLNISRRKFLKLESGEMTAYKHSIDTTNAEQIFLHEKGQICINAVFRNMKRNWSLNDTNDGQCPFILRKYTKVIFRCTDLNKELESNIEGLEIYLNSENHWAFKFRITENRRISSFFR